MAFSLALGIGVTLVPEWATNALWPCDGCSSGVQGLRDAVIMILSTGFCIGAIVVRAWAGLHGGPAGRGAAGRGSWAGQLGGCAHTHRRGGELAVAPPPPTYTPPPFPPYP